MAHVYTHARMGHTLTHHMITTQTSADVDAVAGEIVPQLQQHTEQLTNIFALIDKMSEHVVKVCTRLSLPLRMYAYLK
jgi:hypothetical protein